MKIGILTYHRSINYGAFLQAYALQKYVQKIMGETAQVELIDYHSKRAHDSYIAAWKKKDSWDIKKLYQYFQFQRCVRVLPKSKKKLISDDLEMVQSFLQKEKYDIVIAGSDEIWKADGMRGFPTAYWLNFDMGNTCRVSYAASSRNRIECLKKTQKEYMMQALEKFSYVGVRDAMTGQLVAGLGQKTEPHLNCDPTFLYAFRFNKKTFRNKFFNRYKIEQEKKLLGIMIPDERLCKLLKEKYGKEYVILSLLDELPSADYNLLGLTPFEWVKTIGILDILVTNRFHGTVFAMKNQVPFLSLDDYDEKDNSKIYDLLARCNLQEHYFPYQGTKTEKKRKEAVIKVEEIISRSEGMDFSESIKSERKRAESFVAFMRKAGRQTV